MASETYSFLKRNNITDIYGFEEKNDFNIDGLETNISSMELNHCIYGNVGKKKIPLSKILGFSKSHCKIDKSFFKNFDTFFDSNVNDSYHNRANGMLRYTPEEIMDRLSKSFNNEPIKTISIDDKYYISSNGLHRFMALKLYYMLELYQGKTIEELDKKYMIEVENREIDVFSTFAYYFGSGLNPPIPYNASINKKEWFNEVKKRIISYDKTDYDLLVSTFSFTHFINDNSGEIMIKYLHEYFPSFSIDVFKYLVVHDYYDRTINFMNCIKKYFPNYENEFISIIDSHLKNDFHSVNADNKYEYFDLEQQWNEYGTVKEINNIDVNAREFSEGSQALEMCLKIIWSQNIITRSCCKGNHLTITTDKKPEVECEAYIGFESGDWQAFLSQEIIENDDVIISEHAIHYYGANVETFFNLLSRDFITGKKENKTFLQSKNNNVTDELEYKSFIISLDQIGFNQEQISQLASDYRKITNLMNEFYSSKESDKDLISKEWHKAIENYQADLIFYISRNNQAIGYKK